MAATESLKIIGRAWASAPEAQRRDPEDYGIDRTEGWGVAYEQVGGEEPEREVWNQKGREWDGFFGPRIVSGVPVWDERAQYRRTAEFASFVLGSDGFMHVALADSGPKTGNPTDPTTPGQTLWRRY